MTEVDKRPRLTSDCELGQLDQAAKKEPKRVKLIDTSDKKPKATMAKGGWTTNKDSRGRRVDIHL